MAHENYVHGASIRSSNPELTPLYARYLARLIRPFPNSISSSSNHCGEELLSYSNFVLGIGSWMPGRMGESFPYLLDKVGRDGEVVGVEISPEMAALANKRIQNNGWCNVSVLESAAERANPKGCFDALLMS